GVAGLETNHLVPAPLGEFVANGLRGAEGIREIVLEVAEVQYLNRAVYGVAPETVERGHTGMSAVIGGEYLFGQGVHFLVGELVDAVDILNRDDWIAVNIRIAQGDTRRTFDGTDVAGQVENRNRPEQAVGHGQILADGQRISLVHV